MTLELLFPRNTVDMQLLRQFRFDGNEVHGPKRLLQRQLRLEGNEVHGPKGRLKRQLQQNSSTIQLRKSNYKIGSVWDV